MRVQRYSLGQPVDIATVQASGSRRRPCHVSPSRPPDWRRLSCGIGLTEETRKRCVSSLPTRSRSNYDSYPKGYCREKRHGTNQGCWPEASSAELYGCESQAAQSSNNNSVLWSTAGRRSQRLWVVSRLSHRRLFVRPRLPRKPVPLQSRHVAPKGSSHGFRPCRPEGP